THQGHIHVLAEGRRPTIAQPEIEWRAEDEDEIGLSQREAARLGKGQGMPARQTPAPFMKTGTPAASAKSRRSAAASSQYTPLPAMIMGRSAWAKRSASFWTESGSGATGRRCT